MKNYEVNVSAVLEDEHDLDQIGIQITAIHGIEGDDKDDRSPMITGLKEVEGGHSGEIESSDNFMDANSYRVSLYLRRDDGDWHPEPIKTEIVMSLDISEIKPNNAS